MDNDISGMHLELSFSQSDGEEKQPDGPAPSATNAEESQLKEGEDGLEMEHVVVGKDM